MLGDADFFGRDVAGGEPYRVRAYWNTSRNGARSLHWEPTAEELLTFEHDKRAVMAINGAIECEDAAHRPLTRADIRAQIASIRRRRTKESVTAAFTAASVNPVFLGAAIPWLC
jgi:hypothetical protein